MRWLARRLLTWRSADMALSRRSAREGVRTAPGSRRRAALEFLEARTLLAVAPQTYTVTNVNDSGAGSLRAAIASADADSYSGSAFDTIDFDPSLAGHTIDLTTSVDDPTTGPSALAITAPVLIEGNSAPGLTIARGSGAPAFRVFVVSSTGNLTLNNVTVSGGLATDTSATVGNEGGGLYNAGAVTLTGDIFTNNSATFGGGVYSADDSSATFGHDVFTGNTATNTTSGGGSINLAGSASDEKTYFLSDDTFEGNTGWGIANAGLLTMINSTVDDNAGGGFDNEFGNAKVINSTVDDNTGGGFANEAGDAQLTNDTITDNDGGGIFNGLFAGLALNNTIVAGNFFSGESYPTGADEIQDAGELGGSNNLIGAPITPGVNLVTGGLITLTNGVNGNIVGNGSGQPIDLSTIFATTAASGHTVPFLADNGGPTKTVALAPGSLAVDHGSNAALTPLGITSDQRGFARVVNGTVDIGAFEDQVTATSPGAQSNVPGATTSFNLGSFADARTTAAPYTVTVNWGDGTPNAQFSANAPGSLGTLPHTYAAAGSYTATVIVADAGGGAGQATFTVTNADGPRVTNVERTSPRVQPTSLVLSFDQPLVASAAQNVVNYHLSLVRPRRRSVPIRIVAASYNSATQTVSLRSALRLALNNTYVLTVSGAPLSGLKDAQGLFLDGSGANQPGTNFTTTITRATPVIPPPRVPHRSASPRVSAARDAARGAAGLR